MNRLYFVVALVALAPGCTARKAIRNGATALILVRDTGNAVDKAFAERSKAERARCLKAHGTKTVEYKTCYTPTEKQIAAWHTLRGIVSALIKAGHGALKAGLAYLDGKKDGKKITAGQVLKIVQGVGCAFVKGALAIGEGVGGLAAKLKPLDAITQGVCP